ncbi:MAG TPA: hypothetical protein VFM12_02805 [Gemmatimonadales bacterium]|jgi:hypothetical protein|nr:hypothetical protein [Gemmatimonadales bacterium]
MWTPIFMLFLVACSRPPSTPTEHARDLFERYVDLERQYDPALFDLYADSGHMEKYLVTRAGDTMELGGVSLATWKRGMLPELDAARASGATNRYLDVSYEPDGDFVRVKIRRRQDPPGIELGEEMLVGPGPDSVWYIWRERAQVHSTRY